MRLDIISIDYKPANPVVHAQWVFEEGESDVEIVFDDLQTELLDSVDCYNKTWLAIGYDKEGNKYGASAIFSCDELVELEDIELLESADEKRAKAEWDRDKPNRDFEKEFHPELIGKSDAEKQEFYRQLKR